MYCPNCGRELPDGTRYCGICGFPLSEATTSGEDGTEPENAYIYPGRLRDENGRGASPSDSGGLHDGGPSQEMNGGRASDNEPEHAQAGRTGGWQHSKKSTRYVITAVILAAVAAAVAAAAILLPNVNAQSWQNLYDRGEEYLQASDYEQAISVFTEAIAVDSSRAEAYEGRAKAYLGSDPAQASEEYLLAALSDYDVVLAQDSSRADILLTCGEIYLALGEEEENLMKALESYKAALELDETLTEAYLQCAQIYLALGEEEENLKKALENYEAVLELDETLTEVYLQCAGIYLALGEEEENLRGAVNNYLSAVEQDESLSDLYLTIADLCLSLTDYETAIAAYSGAIDAGLGDAEVYAARAEVCLMADAETAGDEEEGDIALTEYQKAAISDFEMVLTLDPSYTDLYLRIAELYIDAGEYESALDAVNRAVEVLPEDEELHALRVELYGRLAGVCAQSGDYVDAADVLTEGIEAEPGNVDLYTLRGDVYVLLAGLGESGDGSETADDEIVETAETYLSLALDDYLTVTELDASGADAYLAAAEIYEQMGDYDSAIALLETFPEDDESVAERLEAIEEEKAEIERLAAEAAAKAAAEAAAAEAAAAEAAAAEAAAAEAAAAEAAAAEAAAAEAASQNGDVDASQDAASSQTGLTGTFSGSAQGYIGTITVELTLSNGVIQDISYTITKTSGSPFYFGDMQEEIEACRQMVQQMLSANSIDVDGVSGATITSNAFKQAAANALSQ